MKALVSLLGDALVSGSCASVASTLALAAAGRRDCSSAFAPVNAVSHWIWKDRAIRKDAPSLRYTATGYAIHHIASVFWACAFEGLGRLTPARRSHNAMLLDAAAVTALAAAVDLRCTPERLTPGFERRLEPVPLFAVYVAFGIGLAIPALFRPGARS